MATPNVVNLAAKLFALDPSLTPAQVIELIKQGATTSDDGRRHLIDEKRSVAGNQDRICFNERSPCLPNTTKPAILSGALPGASVH